MILPVVFLPEARAEFDEAANWYDQQKLGLGIDFIKHVDKAIDAIAKMPRMHQIVHKNVRRAVVRKYPYVVLYQVEADHLLIVAVFHCKRDPSIWQGRVS